MLYPNSFKTLIYEIVNNIARWYLYQKKVWKLSNNLNDLLLSVNEMCAQLILGQNWQIVREFNDL